MTGNTPGPSPAGMYPPGPSCSCSFCAAQNDPEVSLACKAAITYLHEVAATLVIKNRSYGDSAANPMRVFSSVPPVEQINVRIDDKLSRIARGKRTEEVMEDTERDLLGYLALKRGVQLLEQMADAQRRLDAEDRVPQPESYGAAASQQGIPVMPMVAAPPSNPRLTPQQYVARHVGMNTKP